MESWLFITDFPCSHMERGNMGEVNEGMEVQKFVCMHIAIFKNKFIENFVAICVPSLNRVLTKCWPTMNAKMV